MDHALTLTTNCGWDSDKEMLRNLSGLMWQEIMVEQGQNLAILKYIYVCSTTVWEQWSKVESLLQ